jgi:endonuclease-3
VNSILKTIRLLEQQVQGFAAPAVIVFSEKKDPYLVLISCILSLRTKDKVTMDASRRLFKAADTPAGMIKLPLRRLEKIIYPVGFYRNKAKVILDISRKLLDQYGGRVPSALDELLAFKGVGRKTANLVRGLAFDIPSICVDTHVHRIPNRLGWIHTQNPEQSLEALMRIVPRDYWIKINTILVTFGQNICLPVSPYCSKCYVKGLCEQKGVKKYR